MPDDGLIVERPCLRDLIGIHVRVQFIHCVAIYIWKTWISWHNNLLTSDLNPVKKHFLFVSSVGRILTQKYEKPNRHSRKPCVYILFQIIEKFPFIYIFLLIYNSIYMAGPHQPAALVAFYLLLGLCFLHLEKP